MVLLSGVITATAKDRLTHQQSSQLVAAVQDQITPCWSPPNGVKIQKGMSIELQIVLHRDGTLKAPPRLLNETALQARTGSDFPYFQKAAIDAVIRCAPLRLPTLLYDHWDTIHFHFYPDD